MTAIVSMLLVILGSWLLVTVGTAYATGWHGLAKVYRAPHAPKPSHRGGIRGMNLDLDVGAHRLSSGADITASPEGLYMSKPWYMNLMQPPLLIPWKDLVRLAPTSSAGGRRDNSVAVRDGTEISFTQEAYALIEPYLRPR